MNDSYESVLESWKIQLEKNRKLLLVITSDNRLENETDEEVLQRAGDYGFCIPEDFLNLETDISQNQVNFWNRILKCISYLQKDGTIKENVSNTWNSTYKLEEIANILERTPEESSLGCAELDSDKHNVDDYFSNCELEMKDLMPHADEALNYLTLLSKHTQRFVDNMLDLSYQSDSRCTDSESGPTSIINDPILLKRIELLHHQVKTFDKVLDSFNRNIHMAETKNVKIQPFSPSLFPNLM